jgi:hypothetical protein
VGSQLRITAELSEWLAELRAADPAAAAEAGARLAAALSAEDLTSLAFITDLSVPARADPGSLTAAVDFAASDLLSGLTYLRARERETEASLPGSVTRYRFTPAGSEPLPFTAEEIAEFLDREHELAERLARGISAVKAWQARAELARARHQAASATIRMAVATGNDAAEARQSMDSATRQLTGLLAEAEQLRRSFAVSPGRLAPGADPAGDVPGVQGTAGPAPGLLELAVGRLGTDVRILGAIAPAGTLSLLAVLEGGAAVRVHREAAVGLASDLLAEIARDGWPEEIGEELYADAAAFAVHFFGSAAEVVQARGRELAVASTLAGLRRDRGLAIADLAGPAGMTQSRLWALETGDLGAIGLADLAAYVQAVGGQLDVTARLPDGNHPLV